MPGRDAWLARSRAVVNFVLGIPLFAWLYGVPFLLAAATRQQPWLRGYHWVLVAAVGVYLVIGMASSAATAPLIGNRPTSW